MLHSRVAQPFSAQALPQLVSRRWNCLQRLVVGISPRFRVSFASGRGKNQFNERRTGSWNSLHDPVPYVSRSCFVPQLQKRGCSRAAGAAEVEETEENEETKKGREEAIPRRRGSAFRCLSQIATDYNKIVILEAPETSSSQYAGCRVLLLDNSGNVHSIYNRDSAWTGLYWDEFASLPAVIPEGPVALFGLGGGTAARLLLKLWPFLQVKGYEIDEILVEQARLHLGLSELEIPTSEGGCLTVHVGDALSPSAVADGGFSGIIVDLFSEGGVVGELQKVQTWLSLQKRLRPGGRIMVNCGGICVERGDPKAEVDDGTWTWEDGGATKDATLEAMSAAFPDHLSWRITDSDADNCFALSGPLPNLETWAAALPEQLKEGIAAWTPYV